MKKKAIITVVLIMTVAIGVGIVATSKDNVTPVAGNGVEKKLTSAQADEKAKKLAQKEEYINTADSNTGMDADGVYSEDKVKSAQSNDDNFELNGAKTNYAHSKEKRELMQKTVDTINKKKGTDYSVGPVLVMDRNVMNDAVKLYPDSTLTDDEKNALKFYITNFTTSLSEDDPLCKQIEELF